ncbi:flagellar type III secretion system pore protein FliP [Candidatus Sneabacter namystus]|uniref:Flagellar biosynthetic protein FliP n=1 Tax=Candidatus Sneabacter namystus TaxID=2601646 RepID=A0A5C0UIV8_9RICK|nr:flagellar type III secretion system pore protein FliP [Candidatus Sneabacter namystus]QEK39729.1 flagellar type III secretion system pore protein FliP [Candidatus Sneabacter namystus]
MRIRKTAFIVGFLFVLLSCSLCFASQNSVNINLGNLDDVVSSTSFSGKVIQVFFLIGVLGIAPSILIMVTSFVRISVVFSIVRTAIGLQNSPPTQVLNSLALFLTLFIMYPTFEKSYDNGIKPLVEETISLDKAVPLIITPFKSFMMSNTRTQDISMFKNIAKIDSVKEEVPIHVVIPAFLISELRKAFEIGFLLFLPFLIIDVMVSSTLMALGVMMMPPVTVSLPFKIIFFVLVDGWHLLVGSLIKSFY